MHETDQPSDRNDGKNPGGTATARFDPAFKPAVAAGTLTAQQAMQRGNRAVFADRLVQRHDMSQEVAYAVADNRTTIREVLGGARTAPEHLEPPPGRLSRSRGIVTAAVLLMVAGAMLVRVISPAGDRGAADRNGPVQVLLDEELRVVQIEGANPGDVLERYCASADLQRSLDCVGLMRSPSKAPRLRVGVFEDPDDPESLRAISIHQNPSTLRWSTGDGLSPILSLRAPTHAGSAIEPQP